MSKLSVRNVIDEKTAAIKEIAPGTPNGGWIKAILHSLNMSQAELAQLTGVNQKSIHSIEKSEAARTIRLETLDKIAAALGCEIQYSIVPRHSLAEAYLDQARRQARNELIHVEHTMALENQHVAHSQSDVEALAEKIVNSGTVSWTLDESKLG